MSVSCAFIQYQGTMNDDRARLMWGKWRLPLLGLAILLIVVGPVILLQRLSRANLDAADAVAHTHEVEAAVMALALDVREIESSGMMIALGADHPLARSWDLGVNAYVVKPVDIDQFFQAVRTIGTFWALINQAPEHE